MSKPCLLDVNRSQEYWDSIEAQWVAVKVSPRVVRNRKSKEYAIPPLAPIKESGGRAAAHESSETGENVAKSQMCSMRNNTGTALVPIGGEKPDTVIDKSSQADDNAKYDHARDTTTGEDPGSELRVVPKLTIRPGKGVWGSKVSAFI
jgi:hypothetical protein